MTELASVRTADLSLIYTLTDEFNRELYICVPSGDHLIMAAKTLQLPLEILMLGSLFSYCFSLVCFGALYVTVGR